MLLILIILTFLLGFITCTLALSSLTSTTAPTLNNFVNRESFMTMSNNGKDPCKYNNEFFICRNYTESFDLYISEDNI